ncbi:MAG: hypothetical protein JWQ36_1833 [Enterovirga sp.]|jgi:hypothetical protein|nr:hypothetical protein [Enterovirga sp.]
MVWPWRSPEEVARRAQDREARFVRIGREAYEGARRDLGPQQLKPRDWEDGEEPGTERQADGAPAERRPGQT